MRLPKRLWESAFACLVLGAPPVARWPFTLAFVPAPGTMVAAPELVHRPMKPLFSLAARRLRNIRIPIDEDSLRQRAIHRWRAVVEKDLEYTDLGRTVSKFCHDLTADSAIVKAYADIFEAKATGTLSKRGAALLKLVHWCSKHHQVDG